MHFALEWYRAAAENGDVGGERNFGYLYFQGEGPRRDYAQAAKWFRAAAEQGDCQKCSGIFITKAWAFPLTTARQHGGRVLQLSKGILTLRPILDFYTKTGRVFL
jgi:TPR repeat protein